MRPYLKLIYFAFIYLISDSKWVLVESTDTSPTPPLSSGGDDGTLKNDQDGTATTPADTVKKTPFELDIKKTSGTDKFDYKKVGVYATYRAKDNYAFNVVKDDKTEIWRTEKENEYATKVVLDGKGQKAKSVTITLLDGTTKSYKKDKNNPWSEHTGQTDGSGFELDIKSDEFKSDPEHFDVQESFGGNLYLITFKPRVTCSLVKVDGKEVWQHGSSQSKYGNPKTVIYYKNDNRISINFGANDIEYTKNSDKWEVKPVPKEKSTTNSTSVTAGSGGGTTPTNQTSGGTNAKDSSRGSAGTGEDGSSQPSGGAPRPDGTDLTSGSDGSASRSSEGDGSQYKGKDGDVTSAGADEERSTSGGSSETSGGTSGWLPGSTSSGSSGLMDKIKGATSQLTSGRLSGMSGISGWSWSRRTGSAQTSANSDADASSGVTSGAGDDATTEAGPESGYISKDGGSYPSDPSEDMTARIQSMPTGSCSKDGEEENEESESGHSIGESTYDDDATSVTEPAGEAGSTSGGLSETSKKTSGWSLLSRSTGSSSKSKKKFGFLSKSSGGTGQTALDDADAGSTSGEGQVADGLAEDSGSTAGDGSGSTANENFTAQTSGGDDGQSGEEGKEIKKGEDSQGCSTHTSGDSNNDTSASGVDNSKDHKEEAGTDDEEKAGSDEEDEDESEEN